MEKLKLAKHLIKFVDESPSNYFACINTKNILKRYQDIKVQYDDLLEKLKKDDFENKKYLISYLTNNLFYKLVLLDNENYKKELKVLKEEKVFDNLLNDTLKRKIKN